MSIPKKHHYVPQCYLKEYSDNKEILSLNLSLLLERKKMEVIPKHPSQICYFENFYLIQNPEYYNLNKYDKYFIELIAFKKIENNYRNIIHNLLSYFSLNSIQCISLSDFILQMKIRNPFFLKISDFHKERNLENAKKGMIKEIKDNGVYKNIPIEIIEIYLNLFCDELLINKNFIKSLQLKQIIDKTDSNSINIEKFRESILDCKWILLDSENCKSSFFTSDNPGISLADNGELENSKFNKGFKFYFPINGRYCLQFSDSNKDFYYKSGLVGEKIIEVLEIKEYELDLINTISSVYHNKYIFSNNKDDLIDFGNQLL